MELWLTYEAWQVICCSHYMRAELQRIFHLPEDKIAVIPNGVDPQQLLTAPLTAAERAQYAAADEKIVFFIGRLVQEKGVQILLEAVPHVLAAIPKT